MELTPLIDVVFLLLTFFIFSMILMIRADVMDVRLPTLGSARTADPGPSVTIAVEENGSVAVNGETVELAALADRVRAERGEEAEARILIAVDENASSKSLLAVADRLAATGLGEFSILTRPAGNAAPEEPAPATAPTDPRGPEP